MSKFELERNVNSRSRNKELSFDEAMKTGKMAEYMNQGLEDTMREIDEKMRKRSYENKKRNNNRRYNGMAEKEQQKKEDELIAWINAPERDKGQSTYQSGDQEESSYETMNKSELMVCLKKERENNKELRREIEERYREIKEIKERLEKLERSIEKKNKSENNKDMIENILNEKVKKYTVDNTREIEGHLSRIKEEMRKKEEEKEEKRKIETKQYEEEIQKLKWFNEFQERKRRRNNIIIRGMEKSERRNKEGIEKWIEDKLEINIRMNHMWPIKGKNGNEQLIGVELASWEDKKKVMKEKSVLKEKDINVYIDNDLTWQERRVRRILNDRRAEEINTNQNTRVKVGYYWIEIDKKRFVYDERRKDPGLIRIQE